MSPTQTNPDFAYMAQALRLAERGLCTTHPNPRVGCVLVKQHQIIGQGWHQRAGEPHAEIHALREARTQAEQATAYITLEPCCHYGRTPPCSLALIQAKVARVVIAQLDPNPLVAGQGMAQLQAAGIEVTVGVMQAQAEQLNRGFLSRMQRQRPWVRCKLAMSLDGRTALASGISQWITGEAARHDVHRWRAQSSGILTGIGTVLADNPSLTVRLPESEQQRLGLDNPRWQAPLRIVLDPALNMPEHTHLTQLLRPAVHTLVITAQSTPQRQQALEAQGVEVAVLPGTEQALNLPAVLHYLAQHQQMNEILVEAGATLSGALLAAGLIDELILYLAPHIMGHQARGLFNLPDLTQMDQRIGLTIEDIRAVGQDWRIMAKPTLIPE